MALAFVFWNNNWCELNLNGVLGRIGRTSGVTVPLIVFVAIFRTSRVESRITVDVDWVFSSWKLKELRHC